MMQNIHSCNLTAMAFSVINAPALAQTAYPAKPVRMAVPFFPGGTSDTLARILGQKITEAWGQQVVVDSRPGASSLAVTYDDWARAILQYAIARLDPVRLRRTFFRLWGKRQ